MPDHISSHSERLLALVTSALAGPPGVRRIATAVVAGVICHVVFGMAVLAMIGAMFFGMSASLGRVLFDNCWFATNLPRHRPLQRRKLTKNGPLRTSG